MGTLTLLPPGGTPPTKEVNEQVVATLADLLKRAMDGEIDAIGIAFISDRNRIFTVHTDNDEDVYAALCGAVAVLNTRLTMGDS